MTLLSAVILTKNESEIIASCLKNLDFCSEIILIDDFSSDKTVEIAQRAGAKVFRRNLENDFAAQRNFGLDKTSNDWVLFIDADEVVTYTLKAEIKEKINFTNGYSGYYLKRQDFLWGRLIKHGEFGNTKLLRLGKKNSGKFIRKVHEYWNITGDLGNLKNPLLHYPHKTVGSFLDKINIYSKIHFQELEKEGKKAGFFKVIFYPLLKLKYNYVLKLAFLDGVEGFVANVMISFHSFLSWSDLWLAKKK